MSKPKTIKDIIMEQERDKEIELQREIEILLIALNIITQERLNV